MIKTDIKMEGNHIGETEVHLKGDSTTLLLEMSAIIHEMLRIYNENHNIDSVKSVITFTLNDFESEI